MSFKVRTLEIYYLKGCDHMDVVTKTLYIGIDVSKDSNQIHALDFSSKRLSSFKAPNNLNGASIIEDKLIELAIKHNLDNIVVVLEATGIYSIHIATYLSVSEKLTPFNILVYCINPKSSKNYQKSFVDLDKTDPKDAFMLADFARVGRINDLTPFKGAQKTALQRLTRHRKHLSDMLASEKTRVLNDIFIKFSDFNNASHDSKAFSDTFGATATAILLEYKTTEDIINEPLEDLISFISKASRNRIVDIEATAIALKKAAKSSYRLDKTAYEPINLAIASALNIIKCIENEIAEVDKAIKLNVKGFNEVEYTCLLSIPGIGPVFAAGILAEIGSISQFDNDDALAKYAGITWRQKQSGNFKAEDTFMTKTGNEYLRYYLIEATSLSIIYNPTMKEFYQKKYDEVTTHQHKRALALSSRKFIRLIYGLLSKGQLFSNKY